MKHKHGFTLLEIIGVMAIMAILISVITPNVVRQIARAKADAEDESLVQIGKALEYALKDSGVLAGTNVGEWTITLAPYMDVAAPMVSQSLGNGTRRLILDPACNLLTNPYSQAERFSNGSGVIGNLPQIPPQNVRYILVSSMDGAAPAANLTAAQFDAVWNQTGGAPAAFVAGELLRIGRKNISGGFVPLVLNRPGVSGAGGGVPTAPTAPGNSGNTPGNSGNTPGNSGNAPGNSGNTGNTGGTGGTGGTNSSVVTSWSIHGESPRIIPIGTSLTAYVVRGTMVSLHSDGSVVATISIHEPSSVYYDENNWSWQP
jgi:prepilin-type N-terminal cleavage/methylation domain-containing protein